MTAPAPQAPELLADLVRLGVADTAQRIRAAGDPGPLLGAMADEAERQAISDPRRALDATEALVALADLLAIRSAQARARRARGQALAYANRFDEALAVLRDAQRIAGTDAPVEGARAGVAMIHALARLGRLREAAEVGEQAREALAGLGQPVLAARADVNLGVVHRMLDRPEVALACFDRALPALADAPTVAAQVHSNRGEALLDLCDFAAAERAFSDALGTFERAGANRAASIAEGNLADLLARQGRHGPALHHFERARMRLASEGAPGDAARLAIEQAEAQYTVGLLAAAGATYRAAIPVLEEHGMQAETARARAGFSRVLGLEGSLEEATRVAQRAAGDFTALGQPVAAARATLILGQLSIMAGARMEGRALVGGAMEGLRERPADLAAAHALLSADSLRAGDGAAAAGEAEAGLALARGVGLVHLEPTLRHARGMALRALGHSEEAADELELAASELGRLRGTIPTDRFRATFASSHGEVMSDALEALLGPRVPRGVARAFVVAQMGKSGSLLDALARHAGAPPPAEAAEEPSQELVRAHERLRALLARLQESGAGGPASAALRERIADAGREIEQVSARLAARAGYHEIAGAPASLEEVQAMLPRGWGAIEYVQVRAGFSAFVVLRGGAHAVPVGPVGPVEAALERLRFDVARVVARSAAGLPPGSPASAERSLSDLHDLVFSPLAPYLRGVEGLIVGPVGALHAVPFHSLRDADGYLGERLPIVQTPSASVMARLGERGRAAPGGRPLIVAVADDAAPGIEREAEALRATIPDAVVLTGQEATLSAVAHHAAGAPLVHFATHGAFTPGPAGASGLRLADGWLTAADAARLRVSGSVITLSGCDTGRVGWAGGDELTGLIRAFLGAGARAVLGTLWPIHDRTATEFLSRVYALWYADAGTGAAGLTKALQRARREFNAGGVHPAFWSPYFVVGAL
ncbi:MAG: CHAT domain-containing tetratricopeptide repeat protein [Phycisphaerales bacterium]